MLRRATVVRWFGTRKRAFDFANFVGGCKPLIDALVEAGLFVNDSPKYFLGYYQQRRSPTGDSVEILVEQQA